MDINARARAFADLHRKGDPLILYNIWDAGSAKAVIKAGAKALATGSWSVAAAHGYGDGESVPLPFVMDNLRRIVTAAGDVPVSLDFEGGYSTDPAGVALHVAQIMEAGGIGMNFEDRVIGGTGLHDIAAQCGRIEAARLAADTAGIGFFINARTDIFLQAERSTHSRDHVAQALERARAFADAGADGFFVPGLVDPALIGEIVSGTPLPVNIIMLPGAPETARLRALDVARISYGPVAYREAAKALEAAAAAAMSQ